MGNNAETADDVSELNYAEALEELEEILAGIEEDRFDLDELGDQVDRAAELIHACREKIDATELQIQSIIDELNDDDDR